MKNESTIPYADGEFCASRQLVKSGAGGGERRSSADDDSKKMKRGYAKMESRRRNRAKKNRENSLSYNCRLDFDSERGRIEPGSIAVVSQHFPGRNIREESHSILPRESSSYLQT